MNRRDVVAGLGSLAGIGALASGTGAFSAAEANRHSRIDVVNDSHGLIGLVANESVAGVYTNPSELTIEMGGDDGSAGVNVNSVYQFGKFSSNNDVAGVTANRFSVVVDDDPADLSDGQSSLGSAFAIVNQSESDLRLDLEFDLTENFDEDGTVSYAFELQSSKADGSKRVGVTQSPDIPPLDHELGVGESLGVSFIINALEASVSDELLGSLRLEATSI